jgi:hypothetical protein
MRSKEHLLKEIETLSNSNILKVYDLVLTLKEQERVKEKENTKNYLISRQALRKCSGSLSDDIKEERNDRI